MADQGSWVNASYSQISGYTHHGHMHYAYMHQGYMHYAFMHHGHMHPEHMHLGCMHPLIKDHICMQHTYTHQGQVLGIKDLKFMHHTHSYRDTCIMRTCIMHTCIMRPRHTHPGCMHPGYMHPGFMHHGYMHPTPRIGLSVRSSVRPSVRPEKIPHHGHMHHSSGSRIIDICIIYICIIHTYIRIKDHTYLHRGYMHHANIHWDQGS